jgi:hypothetical protein
MVEMRAMHSKVRCAFMVTLILVGLFAAPASARWRPEPGLSWQWQLQGQLDVSVAADVYDVDGFDTSKRQVHRLHDRNRKVICYISAGAWERWRPDAGRFPARVLGRSNGWAGEKWLDIRRLAVLKPIMRGRLDMCARKSFDGVEFDNVDGYTNNTGFPLSGRDQKRYNRWLAQAAHHRGLAAGLKNDLGQIRALEGDFDFAVNEQCFQYSECGQLRRFIDRDKAVFHVEYELPRSDFCSRARNLGFSSMKKRYSLKVWRRPC